MVLISFLKKKKTLKKLNTNPLSQSHSHIKRVQRLISITSLCESTLPAALLLLMTLSNFLIPSSPFFVKSVANGFGPFLSVCIAALLCVCVSGEINGRISQSSSMK